MGIADSPHSRSRWEEEVTKLVLGLLVGAGTIALTARMSIADIPPPDGYTETCAVDAYQTASTTCVLCAASFATRTACQDTWGAKGYQQKCKTWGASAWSEVWCGGPTDAASDRDAPAVEAGRGGAAGSAITPGRGGSSAGQGGSSAGRGGSSAGQGGSSAGRGGSSAGRGGSSAGRGGASVSLGGASVGRGGTSAGQGGEPGQGSAPASGGAQGLAAGGMAAASTPAAAAAGQGGKASGTCSTTPGGGAASGLELFGLAAAAWIVRARRRRAPRSTARAPR